LIEAIDRWKRIKSCNYNRDDELDYDREEKESRLLERLRNLSIRPNDDENMGITTRKAKELP
jgi:hypothetical protein